MIKMKELTLSQNELKALASQTRVKILKLLNERNHTLSELSKKLNFSSPTIKQHLETLVNTQIIQQMNEGRKWKYYSLTRKGKNMLQPEETNFVLLLSISSIALIGLIIMLSFTLTPTISSTGFMTQGTALNENSQERGIQSQLIGITGAAIVTEETGEETTIKEIPITDTNQTIPSENTIPQIDTNTNNAEISETEIQEITTPTQTSTNTKQTKDTQTNPTQTINIIQPQKANIGITTLIITAMLIFTLLIGISIARIRNK
jgi:DNA-binding transcriptional ArsR family regulator